MSLITCPSCDATADDNDLNVYTTVLGEVVCDECHEITDEELEMELQMNRWVK